MTPEDLIQSLGIEVVFVPEGIPLGESLWESKLYRKVDLLRGDACLVRRIGTATVLVLATRGLQHAHDILHEGLHALLGPNSLGYEGPVWYFQRKLLDRLSSPHREAVYERMKRGGGAFAPHRDFLDELAGRSPWYLAWAVECGAATPDGELVGGQHPYWVSVEPVNPGDRYGIR